ncbi:MAG: helix-turn-helix domain-containing protein [Burkholderiales bacterium]
MNARRKAPAIRRRTGRPPLAEDRAPRDALLDAAVALFAERGVAATASKDIAARAGMTPAMVHYYFRNRDLLLDAVVDERLARFAAQVFGTPMGETTAAALIATAVHRIFAAARVMPWMPGIWIREIVSEGGQLRERMLRHLPVAAAQRLADAVARDQRDGRVPAGIEPGLAFLSIAGATLLPLAVRAVWGRLPGMGALTDREIETHAVTVLTAGLAPAHQGRST